MDLFVIVLNNKSIESETTGLLKRGLSLLFIIQEEFTELVNKGVYEKTISQFQSRAVYEKYSKAN